MTDESLLVKILSLKDEAHALKEEYVRKQDFEAAQRWRLVADDLERAAKTAARPSERGDKVVMMDVAQGEWSTG